MGWYRWQVVRPALFEYDQQAFRKAASEVFPSLRRSFAELCPGPSLPDWNLLGWEASPYFWKHYRVWAVTRMTGCWPLSVLGQGGLPATLPRCGACGAIDVGVDHPLVACRATAVHQDLLARDGPRIQDVAPEMALQVLFCEGLPSRARAAHISYVGTAVMQAAWPAPPPPPPPPPPRAPPSV